MSQSWRGLERCGSRRSKRTGLGMTIAALLVMLAGTLGAIGTVVFAVDCMPDSVVRLAGVPSKQVIGLWFYNGVLYAALGG